MATMEWINFFLVLLETDGPYMAPYSPKGTVAHPGHIPLIAHQIAQLKDVDVDTVLTTVRENTNKMYGI